MKRRRCVAEILGELSELNPEALTADGLDDALIGYTLGHHAPAVAVYSFTACVRVLVERDGMDEESAREYLEFNTLGAWVGPSGPLFIEDGHWTRT